MISPQGLLLQGGQLGGPWEPVLVIVPAVRQDIWMKIDEDDGRKARSIICACASYLVLAHTPTTAAAAVVEVVHAQPQIKSSSTDSELHASANLKASRPGELSASTHMLSPYATSRWFLK